ncbi:MAG: IclR family transcriptional regulator [Bryobacterales bacterium]|nr:IclR family transcriptional regulator [Bryobacterales bacterium]
MPNNATSSTALVTPESERYYSRSIGNALRVLEVFQRTRKPLALSEAARYVRLPKSSVFRILRTFEVAGYLQRIDGDRFALSAATALASNQLSNQVVEVARHYMRLLSQEFGETISLAYLFKNHIEVTAVIDSPHRIQMGNSVGAIIPPHASSLGKCIAAFQTEDRAQKLVRAFGLVRFTPNTTVDEASLSKEFELVRTRGYATDFEESALGGDCVGAPILWKEGHAVAAISISVPKMRFRDPERLTSAVRDAGIAISGELRSG